MFFDAHALELTGKSAAEALVAGKAVVVRPSTRSLRGRGPKATILTEEWSPRKSVGATAGVAAAVAPAL